MPTDASTYRENGHGRDSYIGFNNGGLHSPTHKKPKYERTLRGHKTSVGAYAVNGGDYLTWKVQSLRQPASQLGQHQPVQ